MESLQTRILPRLVLDAISCLWIAHDHVDHDLKAETRRTILTLRKADVTDPARATSVLHDVSRHLRRIERNLEDLERPFTARKIRAVLDRMQHLTRAPDQHRQTHSWGTPRWEM